jgi:hypothetical protein
MTKPKTQNQTPAEKYEDEITENFKDLIEKSSVILGVFVIIIFGANRLTGNGEQKPEIRQSIPGETQLVNIPKVQQLLKGARQDSIS